MCWSGFAPACLEAGTIELLRAVGLGERMDREGIAHDGSAIAWEGRPRLLIDTKKYTGKPMMAYGQTAITEDLYAARDAAGGQIVDRAEDVRLHELTTRQAVRDLCDAWRGPPRRLRLRRRLRRLSRRQPPVDPR